jgi:hypothetical protein
MITLPQIALHKNQQPNTKLDHMDYVCSCEHTVATFSLHRDALGLMPEKTFPDVLLYLFTEAGVT